MKTHIDINPEDSILEICDKAASETVGSLDPMSAEKLLHSFFLSHFTLSLTAQHGGYMTEDQKANLFFMRALVKHSGLEINYSI